MCDKEGKNTKPIQLLVGTTRVIPTRNRGQLYCSFVRSRAPFDALFHLKITEIKFHKRVAKRSQQAWSEAKRAALVIASNRRKKVSFPILYTNTAETLLA